MLSSGGPHQRSCGSLQIQSCQPPGSSSNDHLRASSTRPWRMVGLSASELPPQQLHAGDMIEYFSRAFVLGDSRGHRRAVVTRVNGGEAADFPISVDTHEAMPPDMMIRRVTERSGKPVGGFWRKLRSFKLVPGTFEAPSRASGLKTALGGAVTAACEAVREVVKDLCDEIVHETPQSSVCSSPDLLSGSVDMLAPSAPSSPILARTGGGGAVKTSLPTAEREECFLRSSVMEIVDLVSSEEDQEQEVAAGSDQPSSLSAQKAAAYMRSIPNRHARAKIRHQPKKKRVQWHVPRSRKRRHLAKCAITKSGSVIHHSKVLRPMKFEDLVKNPEVLKELKKLHALRRSYEEPSSKKGPPQCRTVPWPAEVEKITSCRRNGVKFPDIGSFDPCTCVGDCFLDTCSNVASASFCTPKNCKLGARCSNAPRTLDTLKLYDTGRVGLGVYTTTALGVGDVIGEYCGELTEFAAVVEGQPNQALKHNSGYTMLYNAKSVLGNYVYVDALRCGSITRFLSHSCQPNAAFVEQQTRSRVRVLVKMIKNVQAGAQVTVHYGNERWFKCACDRCWAKRTEVAADSEGELVDELARVYHIGRLLNI